MNILAIETSCDDTCIALVKASGGKKSPCFKILSDIISSQVEIHKKWGGVYPTLAKREHQRNLVPVLKESLSIARLLKSKIKNKKLREISKREEIFYKKLNKFSSQYRKPKIDALAVTVGPGLEPCLWTGVNFAKTLSFFWQLPIIPVNHIEAHILANWLSPIGKNSQFPKVPSRRMAGGLESNFQNVFPAICLVVSGGHTQLILMKGFGKYKILGETRDDAAGECFDKVARILGLGYPGGPAIAAEAAKPQATSYKLQAKLPRPMIYQKNYDFSFSGLKTAILYNYKSQPEKIRKSKKYIQEICAETQQAVIDVLIHKTLKAAKDFGAKTIILGGGVAANNGLRKQLKKACLRWKLKHLVPPKNLCTDNATMVATAAYFHWLRGEIKPWKEIEANANLRLP